MLAERSEDGVGVARRVVTALLFLTLLCVVSVITYLEYATTAASVSASDRPLVDFLVHKGVTARGIGPVLKNQGLVSSAVVWRWYVWRHGGLSLKAGRHRIRASMTIADLARTLEGAPLPDDEPFTVIEGWRTRDTDAALTAAGLIKAGAYVATASRVAEFQAPFQIPVDSLEGYLYPETYRVESDAVDVRKLVQRQLDAFGDRFYVPNKDELARTGRSLHAVVTIASMLEREEPVAAQRALVAGILWKRLDRGFALGVDATSRYGLAEWNDRSAFLKRLSDPDDSYNTRLRKGLPPGPIGAPTVESLMAALRPQDSQYLYYLHDSSRVLHPSRNAAEHERFRKQYGVR